MAPGTGGQTHLDGVPWGGVWSPQSRRWRRTGGRAGRRRMGVGWPAGEPEGRDWLRPASAAGGLALRSLALGWLAGSACGMPGLCGEAGACGGFSPLRAGPARVKWSGARGRPLATGEQSPQEVGVTAAGVR